MIIDKTYFKSGELFIPNIISQDAVPQGQASRSSKMSVFIDKYSREFLLNALGVDLFNELSDILKDNTLEEVGNEKWKALVKGEDYTYDGKKYRFDGLEGYEKQSMIAYFVFCKYLRDNDITYTTVGTVRDMAKNSFSVSATPKYVDIWNSFIDMYQGKKFDGEPKIITNPAGLIGVSYYSEEGVQRSLYRYLSDKNEIDSGNFPDFEFKFYKRYNSMGI
jgi:hypothetical protein